MPTLRRFLLAAAVAALMGCSDSGGSASGGGDSNGGSGGGSSASGGGDASAGGGSVANGGGSVSIIVEPSDNASALKAAIAGAQTSIHMTMYLLSNTSIINSLIAQKKAGLEVKVLLNQNLPGGDGSNTSVFNQLHTAGVEVQWAPSTFTLTHEKCVILDGTTAWIMTMNVTQSSPSSNREYLAIDTVPADVAEAEQIFEADFANTTPSLSGALLVAPVNARSRLAAAIDAASSTIDCEGEELSDSQIVSSLASARQRNVAIRFVVADGTPTSAQSQAVTTLKAAGVKLVQVHTPYIHAKSMVFDGTSAYVGSENFTAASLGYNRELGVFVSDVNEVAKIVTATSTDFANGTAL